MWSMLCAAEHVQEVLESEWNCVISKMIPSEMNIAD